MHKFRFIPDSFKLEFAMPEYKKTNYKFAEVIFPTDKIIGFEFPAFLQGETFSLVKFTVNEFTQDDTSVNSISIDNAYKKTGYFETHELSTPLEPGFYKLEIKSANYNAANIIQVKEIEEARFVNFTPLVDNEGDTFIDDVGDIWGETI